MNPLKLKKYTIFLIKIHFIDYQMCSMAQATLSLFMVGVPKKGKKTIQLFWGYFLQITFT
jgi:hypothetical protein